MVNENKGINTKRQFGMRVQFRLYFALVLASILGVGIFKIAPQPDTIEPAVAESTTELAQQPETATAESPLVVIAYLKVKPEHRETFLSLANNVVVMTNETEEGANSYAFYESKDTPNLFFFFEDWQNETAFESHLEQTYTKSLTDKYPEILAEPADIRIYDIDNIQQLQIP